MMRMMENRHAVRTYQKKEMSKEHKELLSKEIAECNKNSRIAFELVVNEPTAFSGFFVTYGRFKNVSNYIAVMGEDGYEEQAGYYGERLVLYAQSIGLNTCWVSGTFNKKKNGIHVPSGKKLFAVIAVGYGRNQGKSHKSKPMEKLTQTEGTVPEWFLSGMKAAMLAPTAMNKQEFIVAFKNNQVEIRPASEKSCRLSLGIVKYHFELGSGKSVK